MSLYDTAEKDVTAGLLTLGAMFGGAFGRESEQRDANRHPTGRRHQPLEMTNDQGSSQPEPRYNAIAREQHEARRCAQERSAAEGPSFLDRMSRSKDANAQPVSGKGASACRREDQLNLFAWEAGSRRGGVDGAHHHTASAAARADGVMHGRRKVDNREESDLREIYPVANAAQLRDGESRKFETSKESNFLNFNRNPRSRLGKVTMGSKNFKGVVRGSSSPNDTNAPRGLMDKLIGGQPEQPEHVRRSRMARTPVATRKGSGPEFQGFPGMGALNRETKGYQHLTRKNVPSNVFPERAEPCRNYDDNDEVEQPSSRRNQRAHPQYVQENRNLYNRATGILPQDRSEPEPPHCRSHENNNPESGLEFGITGLSPKVDGSVASSVRRHHNFEQKHAEIQQAMPHRRTMLYQKRNEAI